MSKDGAGRWRRLLRAWLPTAAWLGVIAAFSTNLFSSAHSGAVLRWIIAWIYGAMPSGSTLEALNIVLRKSAHFVTYFTLSLLAFYSWKRTWRKGGEWRGRWAALALLLSLAAASADEFHQSFLSERTPSAYDVALDMGGAACAQCLLVIVFAARPYGLREGREEASD